MVIAGNSKLEVKTVKLHANKRFAKKRARARVSESADDDDDDEWNGVND